jgi:formylglycine-generating enzyme required for sulfatase activity
LYDVYGNVWEWCGDWHGNAAGTGRVLRGGAFLYGVVLCRSACRHASHPRLHDGGIVGFRVARTIDTKN